MTERRSDVRPDYSGMMQLSVECRNGATAIIIEHVKEMQWQTSKRAENTGALTVHMRDKSQTVFAGHAQQTYNIALAINQQTKKHQRIAAPAVNFRSFPGITTSIHNTRPVKGQSMLVVRGLPTATDTAPGNPLILDNRRITRE